MQGAFRERLREELGERRKSNPRYSLRAFATFLETDHSTLSQILRAKRPIPSPQLRRWARKLGMAPEETAAYIAAEQLPDAAAARRQSQLRHWTAEAMAISSDRTHWELVRLMRSAEFRPDCRWMAEQMGTTVDAVNIAFSRLLRLRLVGATASGRWIETAHPAPVDERAFRILALERIRKQSAEFMQHSTGEE